VGFFYISVCVAEAIDCSLL